MNQFEWFAMNQEFGFAIYQIDRAGPTGFSARNVPYVFDQDQFLALEIDLIKQIVPDPSGFIEKGRSSAIRGACLGKLALRV
jgi:hypothetical protein